MSFTDDLRRKAALLGKHVVLPEGNDPRMIHAARVLVDEKIACVTLLGNLSGIALLAESERVKLDGISVQNPQADSSLDTFARTYAKLREKKGVTLDQAADIVTDRLFFGALMVREGLADGMVAGASHATADVLRAAFQCIGTAQGCSIVSSSFIMLVPHCELGEHGLMLFADCAINPSPDASELADIAVSTARTAEALCSLKPEVAMLSFSTAGSGGEHEDVSKVAKATALVHERAPKLDVTGEIQADAALVEKISQKKMPGDPVAGHANVLIFPDLDSGNIGYKLVQRLAGAEAIGPISQGLARPVNDLSRGCSVDDIVNVAAITILQGKDAA